MDRNISVTYNGKALDIEDTLLSATTVDSAGGEYDGLKLKFSNVEDWTNWKPGEDDRVQLRCEGYETGEMYVDGGQVNKDGYELLLRSCPTPGNAKWACYENASLAQLTQMAAQEMGLTAELYGTTGEQSYRRVTRRNEKWPALLNRLAEREGAALKFCAGKLLLIDWQWAFAQNPIRTIELEADSEGPKYSFYGGETRTLIVSGMLGSGRAEDYSAAGTRTDTEAGEPVYDNAQAARWARGMLTKRNLQYEKITWTMTLEPGISAMNRIDVTGLAGIAGEWIVTRAEHEFIAGNTRATLNRCRTGIR